LAVALLTWGLAASTNEATVLKQSVIIGDALLLTGTLFMLSIWFGTKARQWMWLSFLAAAGLLYVRISQYPPAPYMKNGIFVFNPQTQVAIAIGLLFLLVWLPVSLKVARQVTRAINQESIYRIYAAIYIVSAISALLFLNARRLATIIISFTVVGICFLMLIQSNLVIEKIMEKRHGK
jgi:hypothetical protein